MSSPGYGTGVQNVNLTSGQSPDYGTEMARIQRQQQLAQALQQQADAPIDIQSYNGVQAPIPFTAILAKALSKIGADMKSNRAIKAQGDLSKQEKQDAMDMLKQFGQQPDTTGLTPSASTTAPNPMQYTLQAPSVIPGQAGPSATVQGSMSGIQGVQAGTIKGDPTTYAQKQDWMNQAAISDNPYLQKLAPMMAAQMKPDIRAIGPEGLARVNPDGTVTQVAEGRDPTPPKQTLEEKFVTSDMASNPKETMAEAEHKWAVAKHVTDPNSGGINAANNLTAEEITALNEGIAKGAIDAGKVNSRTAKIMAHMYMGDPTVNQVNSAGHAAMVRSPALQQKIQIAETLPSVLENIRAAGKKLNYSDVAFVGKVQGWLKGQVNDPDFVSYMTQRNDGLMGVASVMRGVGMSDKAVQLEEEASHPTMSPRAVDAYVDAQMKSLGPRLQKYQGIELGPIKSGGSASTSGAPKTVKFEDLP